MRLPATRCNCSFPSGSAISSRRRPTTTRASSPAWPNTSEGRPIDVEDQRAAWGEPSKQEPRWPAMLAVFVAIALQIALPDTVARGLGPRWLLPALEASLAVALITANPIHPHKDWSLLRGTSLTLIGIVNVA